MISLYDIIVSIRTHSHPHDPASTVCYRPIHPFIKPEKIGWQKEINPIKQTSVHLTEEFNLFKSDRKTNTQANIYEYKFIYKHV